MRPHRPITKPRAGLLSVRCAIVGSMNDWPTFDRLKDQVKGLGAAGSLLRQLDAAGPSPENIAIMRKITEAGPEGVAAMNRIFRQTSQTIGR